MTDAVPRQPHTAAGHALVKADVRLAECIDGDWHTLAFFEQEARQQGREEELEWCVVCGGLASYAVHLPGYRMAPTAEDIPGHPFAAPPAPAAAALDRYKPIAIQLLSTMGGIAGDLSVSSLRDARRVAMRAHDDAYDAIARLSGAAPVEGGEG